MENNTLILCFNQSIVKYLYIKTDLINGLAGLYHGHTPTSLEYMYVNISVNILYEVIFMSFVSSYQHN